jgi:hypothetical protein
MVVSSIFALEGPVFTVSIDATNVIYTATPAASAVPGFKPHINFPWLVKRGDGSMVTWWSVGQTHGVGGFGLGATSSDNGATWSAPSSSIPFVPPITQMLPAGQFSRGLQIDHYDTTPFNTWTQSRFLSVNGGVTWTSSAATLSTGAVNYISVYQNPGAMISDGSLLLANAFAQKPGESTFELVLFGSTNGGINWTRRSTVAAHIPGPSANMGEEGPNESDIVQLDNGNLLAVFRTGQPFPNGDNNAATPSIFSSISADKGLTWSTPKMLGVMGSYPHLNKLDDGSLAMTYGRHGAKIMFADESGTRWSFPTTILGESSSGYVRMERRSDGKYLYNYDHSSFYPPSWDGSPPSGYVYANDQMAHMKSSILTITKQNVRDDYHWALQYHGDVSPNQAGQGWNEVKSGTVSGYLWGDLGQDYFRSDTGSSGSNFAYYSELSGAQSNAWAAMDFAQGVVIDVRARTGSSATAESSADIFAGDQSHGYAVLQLTGSSVILEGLGGNASQASYAPVGFTPRDWHDYRIVIEPDAQLNGALRAKVYLDKNFTTPILVNALNPAVADFLRFGDETGANNGVLDLDFLRFSAINGQWNVDADGSWSGFDNWSTMIPDRADRQANFLAAITSDRVVTVDSPRTVGHIRFDNTNRYTLTGPGTITLAVTGGKADITLASGNHTISAPLKISSDTNITGSGTLTLGDVNNTASLSVQANTVAGKFDGTGTLTISTGRTIVADRIRQSSLVIDGSAVISTGRSTQKTSIVGSLDLHAGASMDLGNNDLLIDYSGSSPLMGIRANVLAGTIFSSVAAGDVTKAIGYGDTATLGSGTYSGQSLDATSIVLRFTSKGDANLDGIVGSTDFNVLVSGFGTNINALWTQGDFNFDSRVNTLDFNSLAGNFGTVVAAPNLGAMIPEPAALGIVSPVLLLCWTRSARKQQCV